MRIRLAATLFSTQQQHLPVPLNSKDSSVASWVEAYLCISNYFILSIFVFSRSSKIYFFLLATENSSSSSTLFSLIESSSIGFLKCLCFCGSTFSSGSVCCLFNPLFCFFKLNFSFVFAYAGSDNCFVCLLIFYFNFTLSSFTISKAVEQSLEKRRLLAVGEESIPFAFFLRFDDGFRLLSMLVMDSFASLLRVAFFRGDLLLFSAIILRLVSSNSYSSSCRISSYESDCCYFREWFSFLSGTRLSCYTGK